MSLITLYYREGSSDKIYQVAIEEQNGGWVVHFAYGRRGSALTTGTKTSFGSLQRPLGFQCHASTANSVRRRTETGPSPAPNIRLMFRGVKISSVSPCQCPSSPAPIAVRGSNNAVG